MASLSYLGIMSTHTFWLLVPAFWSAPPNQNAIRCKGLFSHGWQLKAYSEELSVLEREG